MQRCGSNLYILKLRQNGCYLAIEFAWKKMCEFRLTFHLSLLLRFELTIFQHWFRKWPGAIQATSITFKLIVQNSIMGIYVEIARRWTSHVTNRKSVLLQAMAWCHWAKHTWANVEPVLCQRMVSLDHNGLGIMAYTRKLTVTLKIYKLSDAKINRLLLNHAAPNSLGPDSI